MPRKQKTLLEQTDNEFKTECVLEADGVYVVFFEGKPVNIKIINELDEYASPVYKKSMFATKAHCINLADRLNEKFNTDKFIAMELTDGQPI